MRLHLYFATAFILVAAVCVPATEVTVHLCASAGSLMPDTTEGLQKAVTRLFSETTSIAPSEPLVACVVPHGPYGISGKIAAEAFKDLRKGQYKRVIVLGASHADMAFEDCSIAAVDYYATPLGLVPVDGEAIRKLTYSPLFGARAMRYSHMNKGFLSKSERKPLHEYEHSIEIVLPFLQDRLGDFELIPILVGNMTDGGGRYSEDRTKAIARQLVKLVDDETLLVVSTDFTHFGNDFSFRPYNTDILNKVDQLDQTGLDILSENDPEAFENFIKKSRVPICGLNPLRLLLHMMPDKARGTLLARTTSGRFYNDENRSVSYASMNFYLYKQPRPRTEPPAPKADVAGGKEAPIVKAPGKPMTITNIGGRSSE